MGVAARREEIPQFIGPYRITGLLGEGGMGVVYRAVHTETNAHAAVKTLQVLNERMLTSIRRETHALGRISHPGVVRIMGAGVEGGLPWYAMELLEGLTLQRFAQNRWLAAVSSAPTLADESGASLSGVVRASGEINRDAPVETPRLTPEIVQGQPVGAGALREMLTLIRRLCIPLAYLHGEGIVHRDLKPENVFIRPGMLPVLVDFGLVSRFEGTGGRDSIDILGPTMGTPAYMAPEQIRGEGVDARADLYSLGCVLYELLTGRPPFVATTTMELVGNHLLKDPVPPSELVEGVPAALDEVIMRLLAKRPRERIGHASDLAAALIAIGAEASPGYAPEQLPAPRAYLYRPGLAGRDDLVRELKRYVDDTREGVGSLVLLGGESGVGKTRLATEVGRVAHGAGLRVVACECVPLNSPDTEGADFNGAPLHPFTRLLQAIADRCRELGAPETARLLGARGWVFAPYAPSLATVPGLTEFARPAALSAEAEQRRLLDDLAQTLAAFAEDKALLLIVDDLQWADELSLAFLDSLTGAWFEKNPVMILATYRAEERTEAIRKLSAQAWARTVEISRLDESTVGEIVAAMLAMGEAPAGFVSFLAERSEGNPFFVAEYLRVALAERFLFRDENGDWQITGGDAESGEASYESIPLPRSVRDLVGRRLEGLGPKHQSLVEVASVMGREIDPEVLAVVARAHGAMDDNDLLEGIRALLGRQIFEETEAGQLRFVHDRLREIAYQRIADERRRTLHRAVAESIEARYTDADELAPQYRVLAHHWTQSGVTTKAIDYLERAGTQALEAFSNTEALAFFGELLGLYAKEPVPVDALRKALWERSLAEAHLRLGDLAEGRAHAEKALVHCGRPMPTNAARWALGVMGQVMLRALRGVLPSLFAPEAPERQARSLEAARVFSRMVEVFLYANDPLRGMYCGLRNINVAEKLPASPELARGYAIMSVVVGLMSPLRGLAEAWAKRSLELAEELGSPTALAFCLTRVSAMLTPYAQWNRVVDNLQRAIEISRSIGDSRQLEESLGVLAIALGYRAEFEPGREAWREVLELAIVREDAQTQCWGRVGQAECLMRLGRSHEAVEILDEGMEWVDTTAASAEVLWVYGVRAWCLWRIGRKDEALVAAQKALECMKGSRPVVFWVLPAIMGVADVVAESLRGAKGAERAKLQRMAADVGGILKVYGWMFPFARPSDLLYRGVREWSEGNERSAVNVWRRALDAAREYDMKYEEARLLFLLGSHENGPEAAAQIERAAAIFEALGVGDELTQARETLAVLKARPRG